ncbi:MAG: LVIVD repeat-containing protein [Flavobacteriaceae bacterium]
MICYTYSQEKTIISDLEDLTLNIGEVFKPNSKVVNSDGSEAECDRLYYYNKKGVFSSPKSITFDRSEGTLMANEPGTHEVVAICIDSEGKRLSKTFYVSVNYPKIKEVKLSLNDENIYVGNYIPLVYEITDELDTKRVIDFWTTDVAAKYFSEVDMSLTSSNNKIEIDESNNILATEEGSSSIIALFDGVKGEIDIKVKKNPVSRLVLKSSENNVRSGDVINYNTIAYDKKGNVIEGIKVNYSFTGKSSDKSNTASGLILNDGRFVGDVPGKYIISAKVGNISTSKVANVFPREVQREVNSVGTGLVGDKHTSDFWIFEGVDGGDYGVTGTWGADGTAYFWDVSDPSDLKKIDSVQVDARTVNDVKVSQDGKICVITREGASNRKNGMIIIDVSNPRDVKILSEYTKNLTGGVHNVFIDNNHVYALSNGERYYVVNIDDPSNPKEVGMFELGKEGQSIHDVWIEDGIAYSSNWRDGVYLVDVGNGIVGGSPSNPIAFGNYSYASGAHHATFPFKSKSTGKFYTVLGDEIFPNGVNPNGTNETAGFIHFVDFSDLNNPKEVARYELPGHGSHNYWIEDDILYVAMYTGGLRIVDISGDLIGDLYKQGREIGYLLTGSEDGYIPNDTMVWGAQLYKGHVFYSDFNTGLGAAKVSGGKPDNSKTNQHLDN